MLRPADPRPGCVAPEDLTAFAHGELSGASRARVAEHALACAACRSDLASARDRLGRLRSLSRGDVGLALASRRRTRAVAAAALAAAVATAWGVAPSTPGPVEPARGTVVAAAHGSPDLGVATDVAPLLAVQRTDGRWTTGDAAERRDEAATGLALLALLPAARESLSRGAAARAVASGTRWLLSRQAASGRFGSARLEDHAIATSALLALVTAREDVARDDPVRLALDRAVRHLGREAQGAETDGVSALRWSRHALERARSLGWSRVEEPLRSLDRTLVARGERPEAAGPLEGTAAWTAGRDDGAARALRLLRDASTRG
jgi:hypothetical protein